jgi:L-lactate dehydrogenase complex protein LldG
MDSGTEHRVSTFCETARDVGATVARASSPSALRAELHSFLQEDDDVVHVAPDHPDSPYAQCVSDVTQSIVDAPDEQVISSDVGVTPTFAGVARTGSVCLDPAHRRSGLLSLLPTTHVAVLEADRIVPRPRDLFEGNEDGPNAGPGNVLFVTGPSATADMGPLVKGVHGPGALHILLLESGYFSEGS